MTRTIIPPKLIMLVLALALVSCTSSKEARQGITSAQQDDLTEIITKLPAADQAEQTWLNEQLVNLGAPAIRSLAGQLKMDGTGDDTYARYAVDGLAKHVSRPGAGSERAIFENAIVGELQHGHSKPVLAFLMKQLELTGSDRSVPAMEPFLADNTLYASAAEVLVAIKTQAALRSVKRALPGSEGEQRLTLIKALGDMNDPSAVQDVIGYAGSDDWPTRRMALYTLANTGNPAAAEALSAASDMSPEAGAYYLLFAQRLAEEGYTGQSSDIARQVVQGSFSDHFKSSALTTLAQNNGAQIVDELLAIAGTAGPRLRSTALSLAGSLPGEDVTNAIVSSLGQNSPAVQADIIMMLGSRGDASALSAVLPFLTDTNQPTRLAAVHTAGSLGGVEVLSELTETLNRAQGSDETEAVKAALLQLSPNDLLPATARALGSAPNHAKIAYIGILAERGASGYLDHVLSLRTSADSGVRLAVYQSLDRLAVRDNLSRVIRLLPEAANDGERSAIQNAVIAVSGNQAGAVIRALDETPDSGKPYLLEMLPEIGGNQAFNAVVQAANSSDAAVRNAAVLALAQWNDAAAIPALLEAAQTADSPARAKVFEGYVRLVTGSGYSAGDKVRFLNDAISIAGSSREKARVITAFSTVNSPGALQAVTVYFNDSDQYVRDEAVRAAARMLAPDYNAESTSVNSSNAALSVIEASFGSEIKRKIEQQILKMSAGGEVEEGFVTLFNGEDLSGWTGATDSYRVEDGQLISLPGASGKLFTEEEYANFNLRFDFKLTPGANNGIGIRTPREGDPAYEGMEIQVLDNTASRYAGLNPYQFHGSVYGVLPADRGHLNPVGEWNTQEIIARDSRITVILNGETIVDGDILEASTPNTLDERDHPGLLRDSGYIGLLGHGDEVAFRNLRVRDLDVYYPSYNTSSGNGGGDNRPPSGFTALFNGQDLQGWKGLVGNPESRADMSRGELDRAQETADALMRDHWSVHDGVLYFDGEGQSLVTDKDYKDFEMLVDWKIEPHGDTGIYLRGSPQVQIWDITEWPQGSGGIYNNQEHMSDPLLAADNAVGEWNRMRIKMIGDRTTVNLNNRLVVDDVVMENYWNRDIPIYPSGQIELQSHSSPLYFKNIFIREIPRTEPLFNGEDLSGWERVGVEAGAWYVEDGILYTEGRGDDWQMGAGGGWLSTEEMYENFRLELEYRIPEGGNSGIFLRAPREGDPAFQGLEIQLLDDYSADYAGLNPWQYTGSIYDVKAPSKQVSRPAGEWQKMVIVADGPTIQVTLNGEKIINTNLVDHMNRIEAHPGLKRRRGYIGLQNHNTRSEFRNIKLIELD
ncbi:MAG: family 16 glycoside hydrolase [Balneolales bacterium]